MTSQEENEHASQVGEAAALRSDVSNQEGQSSPEAVGQEADACQGGQGLPQEEVAPADGVWRPEHWKNGRFLLVRYIPTGPGFIRERQLYSESRFGSTTNIYESEESAQAEADRLNREAIAAMLEKENDQ